MNSYEEYYRAQLDGSIVPAEPGVKSRSIDDIRKIKQQHQGDAAVPSTASAEALKKTSHPPASQSRRKRRSGNSAKAIKPWELIRKKPRASTWQGN